MTKGSFRLFSSPGPGVAAIPVAVAVAVALTLSSPEVLRVTGDEPHYLVMAEGLVHDGTFDLRGAYAREAQTQSIYGTRLPAPHVVHRQSSLGALPRARPADPSRDSVPLRPRSRVAYRFVSLFAGLLPLCGFSFLRRRTSTSIAAWLTIGLAVAVPIAFGASQIYPDLLAGIIAMAMLFWLLDGTAGEPSAQRWALFWLITGLLPWLNVKFLATTAALTFAAILVLWRDDRRRPLRPAWLTCAIVAFGPATLAAFHVWAFATPLGPRGAAELTTSFGRGAMMFLGLHLDRGQGMFWQQPLLLAGVAALVPFARRHPRVALAWLGAYASLIVPNSLELARFGGGGPAGRFAWSAACCGLCRSDMFCRTMQRVGVGS